MWFSFVNRKTFLWCLFIVRNPADACHQLPLSNILELIIWLFTRFLWKDSTGNHLSPDKAFLSGFSLTSQQEQQGNTVPSHAPWFPTCLQDITWCFQCRFGRTPRPGSGMCHVRAECLTAPVQTVYCLRVTTHATSAQTLETGDMRERLWVKFMPAFGLDGGFKGAQRNSRSSAATF